MKIARLSSLLVSSAAICFGATSLNAAASGAVGAVTFDIPTGPTVVSFPFLKPVEFQGAVSSVSGADVTFGTAPSPILGSAYVHVLDGTDAGKVYDIESFNGVVVTLKEVPSALAATDVVAIRSHMTVSDLGTPPNFTSLLILRDGGSPIISDYLYGSWTDPNLIIYPGEGAVINNSAVWTVTLYGSVSEDDVIFSASSGAQIIGNIDPVNGSSDVLDTILAGAPNFTSLLELKPSGVPAIYDFLYGSWTPDPTTLDTSGYKTFVINTGSGLDIVNAGILIAP